MQNVSSRFAWLKTKTARVIIIVSIIIIALLVLFFQQNMMVGPKPLTEGEQVMIRNMIEGDKNPPVVPVTTKEHTAILKSIETDTGQNQGTGSLNEAEQQSVLGQIQAE